MKKVLLCFGLIIANSAWAYDLTEAVVLKRGIDIGAHQVGACRFSAYRVQVNEDTANDKLVYLKNGIYRCKGSFSVDGDERVVTVDSISNCRPATDSESPVTNPPCSFPE